MSFMEEKEILDGIREELVEHNRIQRIVAEQLERAAASVRRPRPELARALRRLELFPREPGEAYRREQQFRRALQIVRDALDEGHTFPAAGTLLRERLFSVEAILSARPVPGPSKDDGTARR